MDLSPFSPFRIGDGRDGGRAGAVAMAGCFLLWRLLGSAHVKAIQVNII